MVRAIDGDDNVVAYVGCTEEGPNVFPTVSTTTVNILIAHMTKRKLGPKPSGLPVAIITPVGQVISEDDQCRIILGHHPVTDLVLHVGL